MPPLCAHASGPSFASRFSLTSRAQSNTPFPTTKRFDGWSKRLGTLVTWGGRLCFGAVSTHTACKLYSARLPWMLCMNCLQWSQCWL